jgi:hypothetical protein
MESLQDTYQKYCKYCRDVVGIEPLPFSAWVQQRNS